MILRLIERVHDGTIAVAHMLRQLERQPKVSPDEMASVAGDGVFGADASRVARIIVQAWRSQVRTRHLRRPDVLALTCDVLTNPEVPLTRDAIRYALVLGLRMVYGVEHTSDSMARLRDAYTDLSRRFEGQVRRRQRKSHHLYESLLLDLACMEGSVSRSLRGDSMRAYYSAFEKVPFGVDGGRRAFGSGKDWPELHGMLPDFSTLERLAFAQPTAVTGLDRVMLGMLGAQLDANGADTQGGLVTLIGGRPGSGKTTLALTLAARMAEFGSVVSYVATEESPHALGNKLSSVVQSDFLGEALGVPTPRWDESGARTRDANPNFVDGRGVFDLEQLVKTIVFEMEKAKSRSREGRVVPFLAFPRVLVIDSITALVHRSRESSAQLGRQRLAELLSRLRDLGLCVFLTGGPDDCADEGLAYLVDNVFSLDTEIRVGSNHPLRVFDVQKTRQQASYRGRHVFHLSRSEGFVVNPSLHAVSRALHAQPQYGGRHEQRRIRLWDDAIGEPVTVRSPSHLLVFGHGSSGKARLAMQVACAPQDASSGGSFARAARVLVVSFLYDEGYYESIVEDLMKRHAANAFQAQDLSVLSLYPGYLDPETLVAQVARVIRKARLEGRPFTSVVVDGIHNLLLQFPLLQNEALLWPTLFRMFRVECLDAISTFTFFELPSSKPRVDAMVPSASHAAFFHLLVCSCDYSIVVERELRNPSLVHLELVTGLSHGERQVSPTNWNPATFRFEPVRDRVF